MTTTIKSKKGTTIIKGGKGTTIIKGGKVTRLGRPPKGPYEDKRKTLSTRITSNLRTRLEEAAEETGRSLSQEIEFRLEQSFKDDEAVHEALGGKHVYALMRLLGSAVLIIETGTDKRWRDDRATHQQVKATIGNLLDGLGPHTKDELDDNVLREKADGIGNALATVILKGEDVQTEPSSRKAMMLINTAANLANAMDSEQDWLQVRTELKKKLRRKGATGPAGKKGG